MSCEATIVCDRCSRIIAAANTAEDARKENRQAGGQSRSPWDLCQRCVVNGNRIPRRVESAGHRRPA